MEYTCAIIENQPLAEYLLKTFIKRYSFFDVLWTKDYYQVGGCLSEPVDLIFIDVQEAPVVQDQTFQTHLNTGKKVILTSTYPAELLDAPSDVLGVLEKPISFDAFSSLIEKFVECPEF